MTGPNSMLIPRRKGAPGPEAFDTLRAEGIAHIQDLAGSVWTDYNAHDPGVTILEQLCFALTDLFYRADFPVEDILTGPEGAIDWNRQGLLPPEDVFPCRPTTAFDYRAAILADVPEVENAWVDLVEEAGRPTGLYRIRLRLRSDFETSGDVERRQTQAREKVRQVFLRARNLCEDLISIDFVPTSEYRLAAQVTIRQDADPADILARIYLCCQMVLAGPATFQPYDRAVSAGVAPEEMFRGPFTRSGMIEGDGAPPDRDCTTADILSRISAMDGVEGVRAVAPLDTSPGMKSLHWPQSDADIGVKLFVGSRPAKVTLHELTMRYRELDFTSRGATYMPSGIAAILPRPVGQARPFADYQSVQYLFPAIYGLGPNGIEPSEGAKRKAQSEQLRAYLLMFDQPMADCLAGLNNLRQLYSTELNINQTYFAQVLDEDAFPGIGGLSGDYGAAELNGLLGHYPHGDRSKRLLDYLLALYGESFQDDYLRHSAKAETPKEEVALIEARIAYLGNIAAVTRDRGAAPDLRRPPGPDNRSGLETKLSHLLGFYKNEQAGHPGVRLVEHSLLRPVGATVEPSRRFHISLLFPSEGAHVSAGGSFHDLAAQAVLTACPAHIHADLIWLDDAEMRRFEGLYQAWWGAYRDAERLWLHRPEQEPPVHRKADERARALEGFLRQRRRREKGAE